MSTWRFGSGQGPESASDEDLLGRLADGQQAALQELLRRYERPLSSFLYRQTGGRDVEDLYQETWIKVVRHTRSFDPQRRFSTWLFQIAVNNCRDWRRRQHSTAGPAMADEVAAPGDLEDVERGMEVRSLLAQLPEAQREVVILRYYHDLGEEETADILGCPRGTVKSRLHNALGRMAALVAAEEA